jgi:hypothetical protein
MLALTRVRIWKRHWPALCCLHDRPTDRTTIEAHEDGRRRRDMMESQAGERASLDMMTESEPRRLPVRDSLSDLLGPDVILPQQFFDGPRGDSDFSPEKALMLAILEDAIRCFQEYFRTTRARPRMLSRQAERWIRTRDWNWPFSFNNVCEALGIDSDCMRDALLRMKYEHLMTQERPRTYTRPARIVRLNARAKGGKR